MVKLTVNRDGSKVYYDWTPEIEWYTGTKLYLNFKYDLSRVPDHILNYCWAIFMMDAITEANTPVHFSEITAQELVSLERIFIQNYDSQGCGGKLTNIHNNVYFTADKIIQKEHKYQGNNKVIVCNGLGKDGINCIMIAKKLGYKPHAFTLDGQYMTLYPHNKWEIAKDRHDTAEDFYEEENIRNTWIDSNYWPRKGKHTGFYPYALGIILAIARGSNVVLDGIQIHNNKRRENNSYYCYGETVECFEVVSVGAGVTVSSPLRALSNYGSQKLLVNAWPHLLKYQRSCMFGLPWCMKCSKCHRKALYLDVLGVNGIALGMDMWERDKLKLEHYMQVGSSVLEVLKKKGGHPYHPWIENASAMVLKYAWEGTKLAVLFAINGFSAYWSDPPTDKEGYALEPSRWYLE